MVVEEHGENLYYHIQAPPQSEKVEIRSKLQVKNKAIFFNVQFV